MVLTISYDRYYMFFMRIIFETNLSLIPDIDTHSGHWSLAIQLVVQLHPMSVNNLKCKDIFHVNR